MLLLVSCVAGCGSSPPRDDRSAIAHVLEDARGALLRNDGPALCNLLSATGRRRSLAFQVDFTPEGTPVPSTRPGVPRTCEEIVDREWRDEHLPNVDQSWTPDLRRTRFVIVALGRARARVELQGPMRGNPPTLTLAKTAAGWRVEDFSALPIGH